MDILFRSKRYPNFEKTPNVRAEWGEDLVKHFYQSMGFFTFRTKDIDHVGLDTNVKEFIDILFKNKDLHSIDVVCFFETKEQKKQRMKDEAFVKEIIEVGKPYDLGRFLKGKYHLDIVCNKSREGELRKEFHLLPHMAFIEVKTFLKTSKPPIISLPELYRLLYWKERMGSGAIFLAIIEIDLVRKRGILNFVFPEKFHNLDETWYKLEESGFLTLRGKSKLTTIKLPMVIERNKKPYTPILFVDLKGSKIRFAAHTISYEVDIETA
jgi:hypothetical protein